MRLLLGKESSDAFSGRLDTMYSDDLYAIVMHRDLLPFIIEEIRMMLVD